VEYDIEQNLDSVNNTPLGESLASKSLGALRDKFWDNQYPFDKTFKNDEQVYLDTDKHQDNIICTDYLAGDRDIESQYKRNDNLIDKDASIVNANFESCHVGETIIPALKEETQVQQAANFQSDQSAQYQMEG